MSSPPFIDQASGELDLDQIRAEVFRLAGLVLLFGGIALLLFLLTLLVGPVGSIASLAPLPGGSGAIETVLVTLLVSTTAVPAAVAASAVLIHRGATYLFPTLLGAGVASALGADRATANMKE
jgi:uncharacterized membrane protein YbhN (UPF0104 family)